MGKRRDAASSPSVGQPHHRANVSSPVLPLYKGREIKMDEHVKGSSPCCEKKTSRIDVSVRG